MANCGSDVSFQQPSPRLETSPRRSFPDPYSEISRPRTDGIAQPSRKQGSSRSTSKKILYADTEYPQLIREPTYSHESDSAWIPSTTDSGDYNPEYSYPSTRISTYDFEHIYEALDDFNVSTTRSRSSKVPSLQPSPANQVPSLPAKPANQVPSLPAKAANKVPPPVASKPDFLHSRNPFAKKGPPDPYVGSGAVVGLKKKTFKKFIRDLDAAFVLFYDPCDELSCGAKVNMRQAAHTTQKENHAYAAVDCSQELELCDKEKIVSTPTMKLFAKGMTVHTYNNEMLLSKEIRKFVENAPLVRETVLKKSRCRVQ